MMFSLRVPQARFRRPALSVLLIAGQLLLRQQLVSNSALSFRQYSKCFANLLSRLQCYTLNLQSLVSLSLKRLLLRTAQCVLARGYLRTQFTLALGDQLSGEIFDVAGRQAALRRTMLHPMGVAINSLRHKIWVGLQVPGSVKPILEGRRVDRRYCSKHQCQSGRVLLFQFRLARGRVSFEKVCPNCRNPAI